MEGEFLDADHNAVENEEEGSQLSTDSAVILGATSSTLNNEGMVMSNPHLRKLFNKMLDERIRKSAEQGESSSSQLLTSTVQKQPATPNANNGKGKEMLKSPSDTTVYVPALQRINAVTGKEVGLNLPGSDGVKQSILGSDRLDVPVYLGEQQKASNNETRVNSQRKMSFSEKEIMSKISDFVEQLRLEQEQNQEEMSPQQPLLKLKVTAPGYDDARRRSEQAIIEAEKFRAAIETTPTGRNQNFNEVSGHKRNSVGTTRDALHFSQMQHGYGSQVDLVPQEISSI